MGTTRIFIEIPKTRSGDSACKEFKKSGNVERFGAAVKAAINHWRKEGNKKMKELCKKHKVPFTCTPYPFETDVLALANILVFIIKETGVHDVFFFDDYESLVRAYAYIGVGFNINAEMQNNSERSEELEKLRDNYQKIWWLNSRKNRYKGMIKNIEENLADISVVFCGADHAGVIGEEIQKVALQQTKLLSWDFEKKWKLADMLGGGKVIDAGSGKEIVPRRREEE